MEADFASAVVPSTPVRCIGVPLKPFSLGHLLLLKKMESSFVSGGGTTYPDFIAAAFVCVHSWDENLRMIQRPFRRWLFCKVWSFLAGRFNVPIQAQVLAHHINSAREMPESKPGKPGATRYLFSEWETRIYKLLRSIGLSNVEAMDAPLAMANAILVAQLEEDEKAEFKVLRDDPIVRSLSAALEKAEREGYFAT